MAQLIAFPEVAARIDLAPEDLADDEHRQILELLRQGRRPGEFPAQLAATAAALAAQTAEPATYQDIDRAIEIAALRLREQGLLRRLGDTQAALARASAAEAPDLAELVSRLADDLASVQLTRERATVLRGALEE